MKKLVDLPLYILAIVLTNGYYMIFLLMIYFFFRMGAGDLDFRQLSQQIELKTGGLSVDFHVADHHTLENTFQQVEKQNVYT